MFNHWHSNVKTALICSICQFEGCKYSNHGWYQPSNIIPLSWNWKEICRYEHVSQQVWAGSIMRYSIYTAEISTESNCLVFTFIYITLWKVSFCLSNTWTTDSKMVPSYPSLLVFTPLYNTLPISVTTTCGLFLINRIKENWSSVTPIIMLHEIIMSILQEIFLLLS